MKTEKGKFFCIIWLYVGKKNNWIFFNYEGKQRIIVIYYICTLLA